MEPIVPEVIEYSEAFEHPDGFKRDATIGIQYSSLVALLIEAIKELSAKVEVLEARHVGV